MQETLEGMFERAWPYLGAAILRYGKTHSKDHVWKEIVEQRAQLHPLARSAILTSVEKYPTGLRELRFWLAGGDLNELINYEPIVCNWGKEIGCDRASIIGRKGWVKALPSYRETGILLVKDL